MLPAWLPSWLQTWYEQRRAVSEFTRLQKREDAALIFDFADEIDAARTALGNGLRDDALRRWRDIRRRHFNNALRSPKSFGFLTDMGNYDEAEELAQEGSRRWPREAFYLEQLAEVTTRRGDRDEAVRRWSIVQKAFP